MSNRNSTHSIPDDSGIIRILGIISHPFNSTFSCDKILRKVRSHHSLCKIWPQ